MKSAELLQDQTLQKSENRIKRVDEIEARVARWVATQTAADVVQILQQAGVPSAIVARSKDLLTDNPHLAERGYWQQIDHPEVGETTFTAPPYLIDGKRLELKRPPLIGEHTEMVLRDILGCDTQEIARLKAEGILQ